MYRYGTVRFACVSMSSVAGRTVCSIWNTHSQSSRQNIVFNIENTLSFQYVEMFVRYRTHSYSLLGRRVFSKKCVFDIEHNQSSMQKSVFKEEHVRYRTHSNSLLGRRVFSKKCVFDTEHIQSSRQKSVFKEECVQYRTQFSTYWTVYTDAFQKYCNITVHTTVFLKMDPRFRNMQKTSTIKN